MTWNRLKKAALGVACYAAGMYLLKMGTRNIDNSIETMFDELKL